MQVLKFRIQNPNSKLPGVTKVSTQNLKRKEFLHITCIYKHFKYILYFSEKDGHFMY